MAERKLPTIQNGTSGEAVRLLQQLLITFGYLNNNNFDANFGSVTENAVKQFQRDRNLKDDGVVGPTTWSSLSSWAGNVCEQVSP